MSSKAGARSLLSEKVQAYHWDRQAVVYVRQSTLQQLARHQESTRLQYGLVERAAALGWSRCRIEVIDDDLGKSGATAEGRFGFQRLVTEVSLNHVGIVLGIEMSRLARSCRDVTVQSPYAPTVGRGGSAAPSRAAWMTSPR
jgi:hypothetical protein